MSWICFLSEIIESSTIWVVNMFGLKLPSSAWDRVECVQTGVMAKVASRGRREDDERDREITTADSSRGGTWVK